MKFEVTKEFIIDSSNAPTPSAHASTLVKMDNGEILAAWFGGKHEKNDDVDIWYSRRNSKGWSKPERITAAEDIPHWNPVLYKKEDGTVVLFFKVGKEIADWQTYYVTSTDNARTWSKPVELVVGDVSGGRGPVKNKAIRLQSGRILAPTSCEKNKDWKAFVDYSDDDMKTWERTEFVERPKRYGRVVGMIQPTLWESEPDKVHMLLRTNAHFIYRSDSVDGGKTWCPAYKTALFNNNSGIDVAQLNDGKLYLVMNPIRQNWGERTPLNVIVSEDNGNTWDMGVVLESMPGEYSYPGMIADGNELLITYTWNRKFIVFAKVKVVK